MASDQSDRPLVLVSALFFTLLLALDFLTPLGVADGVLYSSVLLLGLAAHRRGFVWRQAAAASLVVVLGGWLSPWSVDWGTGIANRALSLVSIAATSMVIARYKRSEHEERSARARAHAYLEMAGSAIVVLDAEGRVQRINGKARELLGAGHEALGADWFERYVAPVSRRDARATIARLAAEGRAESVPLESHVLGARGDERRVLWHCVPMRDEDGPTGDVILSGLDMTEQRRYEEALRRSMRDLQDLKEALDQACIVAVSDADGTIRDVNDRFCQVSGYRREELVGRDHRIVRSGVHGREFIRDLWSTIRKGAVWRGEICNRAKDGTLFWVDTTIVPFLDEQGRPIQYLDIRTDVTQRKRAEAELLDVQARLDTVLRNAPIVLWATDGAGTLTLVEGKAKEALGLQESDVGRRLAELLPGAPWMGEELARALRGESFTSTHELGAAWLDIAFGPIRDEEERIVGATGVVHDITERHRAEQMLREQEALTHLGEMAAIVAHEVKNPLAGIAGAIGIIGSRLPEDSADRRIITTIQERMASLNDMVQDLLLFARPRPPRLAPVHPLPLLRDAAALLSRDPQLASVSVDVTGEDPELHADEELLKEVFTNLLLNAAQAMGRGVVKASVGRVDGRCTITVADQGPGLPAGVRQRLFEPFVTTKSRGTGLGLAISRRIIDGHNGSISLASPPGGGTTVTIALPLPH